MVFIKTRHCIPGRVRFDIPVLKKQKNICLNLKVYLDSLPEVKESKINITPGTVLICYHPNKTNLQRLRAAIGIQVSKMTDVAASSDQDNTPKPSHMQKNTKLKKEPEELPIPLQIAQVTVSGMVLLVLAVKHFLGGKAGSHGGKLLNITSATTLFAGYPIIRSGISGLIKEKKLNNDLLIGVATMVALFMGEGITALAVVWLVILSTLLQTFTLDRSRRAIGELLKNKNEQAWLLLEGTQVAVPVDTLKPGDVVVVHTGEKIPVDGRICTGTAAVNQAPITGESMPVFKQQGDLVYAGTVVEQGNIHICSERVGDQTALSRIIHLVEDASNKKAPIQNLAESYSYKIVPMSLLLASLVFLLTRDIQRTMTILIVACPCAAGLATPTAISAAMGNAARRGILVKGGCYLEAAGKLDAILFDKTGTLTEGRPEVSSFVSLDEKYTPGKVVALAAAGEMHTNHPLALAVIDKAREMQEEIPAYRDKELFVGMGLKAVIGDDVILIGSERLMEREKIDSEKARHIAEEMCRRGESVIYVSQKKRLIGLIGVRDRLHKNSKYAVQQLKAAGVSQIGLVSGDNPECARAVGDALGLHEVWSDMLPEDKVKVVRYMQQKGKIVAMVGEGINDSPALAAADIGIAMGVRGTDVAVESADVVLAGDDPVKVAHLLHLSRRTVKVIHQNFAFAIGANALGITLGAFKLISPFTAAVLHNASTLSVVINSARLISYTKS